VQPYQTTLLGSGEPGVDRDAVVERVELGDGAWLDLGREWLQGGDTLLAALVERVPWQHHRRWMYDRVVDDPRLSCFADPEAEQAHPALRTARRALEDRYGVRLRGPAFNYYRDGRDSVAPHADRELRELDDTIVAILTVGARRPFLLKAKAGGPSRDLAPGSGDLLVMGGATQRDWEHAVPKVRHAGPRVSVSWRWSKARSDGST
jgi:alkylated DNA repair dioxygenase AlkB